MVSKQIEYKVRVLLSFPSLRDRIIWIEDSKEWRTETDRQILNDVFVKSGTSHVLNSLFRTAPLPEDSVTTILLF